MPLTAKGAKIKRAMRATYPSKKKADQVFYASQNAGKITGTHKERKKKSSIEHRGKTFHFRGRD